MNLLRDLHSSRREIDADAGHRAALAEELRRRAHRRIEPVSQAAEWSARRYAFAFAAACTLVVALNIAVAGDARGASGALAASGDAAQAILAEAAAVKPVAVAEAFPSWRAHGSDSMTHAERMRRWREMRAARREAPGAM